LHSYFLRPGDPKLPIVYDVDCIRDGSSFTTRRVVAIQNGKPIFTLAASFQVEEPGYDHGAPMPDVPAPETLPSEIEVLDTLHPELPEGVRRMLRVERPIEVRSATPLGWLDATVREPRRQMWYRAAGELPDDPAVHRYLLAYASDFNFLTTALQPHGTSLLTARLQVASLDHAMWFHRPFRFDDWLLYDVESPSASGARGLVHGRFYRRDGTLVASVSQEGLVRKR
jgi:acyl-CoA thioesterase-2